MYKCKHFGIKELVSPKIYLAKGAKAWRFFNPEALKGLDQLREEFGPCYINTWGFSGPNFLGQIYQYSGVHLDDEFKRSVYSGHPNWGAFDIKFKNYTAEEVRIKLLGEEPTKAGYYPKIERYPNITELEVGITWFHARFCSNVDGVLVYPIK
ncbi:MAG: hypothetical protein COB69_00360 [Phycisphaera sp.]|nr:MAG: hypothetical protein COB69_00360 [Phycisphaera sp.]